MSVQRCHIVRLRVNHVDLLVFHDVVSVDEPCQGEDVLERVGQGEGTAVTRDGPAVVHATVLPPPALTVTELRRRRHRLPAMDPEALRRDVGAVLDTSLPSRASSASRSRRSVVWG